LLLKGKKRKEKKKRRKNLRKKKPLKIFPFSSFSSPLNLAIKYLRMDASGLRVKFSDLTNEFLAFRFVTFFEKRKTGTETEQTLGFLFGLFCDSTEVNQD